MPTERLKLDNAEAVNLAFEELFKVPLGAAIAIQPATGQAFEVPFYGQHQLEELKTTIIQLLTKEPPQ